MVQNVNTVFRTNVSGPLEQLSEGLSQYSGFLVLNDLPPLSALRQKKLCLNLGGTSFREAANFTKRIRTTRSKVPFLKSFFSKVDFVVEYFSRRLETLGSTSSTIKK